MTSQPPTPQSQSRLTSPLRLALINQLGYPGLGTILAGHKIGWLQAGIMTLGVLAYFVYFLFLFQHVMPHLADILSSGQSWNYHTFEALAHPYRWLRWAGLAASLLAWFWSLWSTIQILKTPEPRRS